MTSLSSSIAALPLRHITLPGTDVAYRQDGTGPPLLLIHGWGGSSRYWLGTIASLADIRTLYALDLPGFGASQPLAEFASAERLATLVIEFADALGIDTFDLNGHSFGAGVAAYLAARWSNRIHRVTLTSFSIPRSDLEMMAFAHIHYHCNAFLSMWRPWLITWNPWMSLWRPWIQHQWTIPPLSELLASRFFYNRSPNESWIQESIVDMVQMDLRTAFESATSLGDPAIITALSRIQAPTLLITGSHDVIMPTPGTELAAHILPHGRLAKIDACGHVPMLEQPHIYHQTLRHFLLNSA